MYKTTLISLSILFVMQGCIAKNQDMYAEQSFQDSQKRSAEKGAKFQEAVVPIVYPVAKGFSNVVGGVIVGTIQGVSEVATYTVNHPELIEQGIKTYQQVEYEQRRDRRHAYKASSDLREITSNGSSTQNNIPNTSTTNSNSGGLQYSYTETGSEPIKAQLRECITYRVEERWIDIEGKVENSTYANFYRNKQPGSKISCDHLAKCTLYKIAHKDYTHTTARTNKVTHKRINYVVVKRIQLLEPSDICYTDCPRGSCDTPYKVDAYIDSNYYDKIFYGGTSIQQ